MKNIRPLALTLIVLMAPEIPAAVAQPYAVSGQVSEAVLFEPGDISTGDYELNSVFTNDGRRIYFTRSTPDRGFSLMTIVYADYADGSWGPPRVAPFSGQFSDVDPAITADGESIYYISRRPISGDSPKEDFDIWVSRRSNGDWGTPENIGEPVNTDENEYYPGIARSGRLYFSAQRPGSYGSYDLWTAAADGDGFSEPVNLGPSINSGSAEIDLYVDPDERFLIFVSYRDGGQGNGDLYISYNEGGVWSRAVNLGDKVNTSFREYCPFVSPDGKYLFFTSERMTAAETPDRPLDYTELKNRIDGPGNGLGDIYFIELEALTAWR